MKKKIHFPYLKFCFLNILFLSFFCHFFASDFKEGLNFANQEKFQEAKICFQKQIKNFPNDANAYYNLGLIESREKNYPLAIWYFEKSLKINPKLRDVASHIENCNKELGNNTTYDPPLGYFQSKLFEINLQTWSILSVTFSVFLATSIFCIFTLKKRRKLFLLIAVFFFFISCFLIFMTGEKANYLSQNTHAIVQEKIENTFVDKTGNALQSNLLFPGERLEIIEEDKNSDRIGLKILNGNLVWIDKRSIKEF